MLLDLTGKKILVTGIANNRSIAWGIAQQLKAAGAELGITYLPDDKGRFEAKVRELTAPLEPSLFLPLERAGRRPDGIGVLPRSRRRVCSTASCTAWPLPAKKS